MKSPSIAVVCPTYNSANFITNTLQSVLCQEQLPDEIIISDDGSKDETLKLVRQILANAPLETRCIVLENSHAGPGAARNAGILAASSDFIAFLDSDDLWHPEKILRCHKALSADPSVNFLVHWEVMHLENGRTKELLNGAKLRKDKNLSRQLYSGNMFSTSAVVCCRALLAQCGGFDTHLSSAQDYELWLRMSPYIRTEVINSFLGTYIVRSNNITSGRLLPRFTNEIKLL